MPKEHIIIPRERPLPLSNAVIAGGFVYTSGHAGLRDKDGNKIKDINGQTQQTMESLKKTLDLAGVTFDDAIKSTVFLKNPADFSKMNEVYGSYFEKTYPVRSTVVCDLVRPDMLVEIELVLYKE
jgi:2-iminobutanoate/2-iminopropanoate deaminase